MSVIFVVVPLAVALAVVGVIAFVWASRSGQFDDLHTPGIRILHDDPPPPSPAPRDR